MIDWSAIDTVLLDMDGTLLDLHYDNYFWMTHLPTRYAQLKQIPLAQAQQQLQQQIASIEGTLQWYCLDYWSRTLAVDIAALKAEIKHKIKQRPYATEFLQFLQAQQKHVVLITNAHPVGLELKFTETDISDYLDRTISSHQFQQPKENQAFWHALQKAMPFDPERCLFIDDNLSVLQSGQQYGIKHILGIHQPDSQIPRKLDQVMAIDHFNEIMNT